MSSYHRPGFRRSDFAPAAPAQEPEPTPEPTRDRRALIVLPAVVMVLVWLAFVAGWLIGAGKVGIWLSI